MKNKDQKIISAFQVYKSEKDQEDFIDTIQRILKIKNKKKEKEQENVFTFSHNQLDLVSLLKDFNKIFKPEELRYLNQHCKIAMNYI